MKKKMEAQTYFPWIEALVIVSFDIDEGQKISQAVPNNFSQQKEKQISMLAFPDSNSFSEYQGIYKYLFKNKEDCFGFVCFKQKKDSSNKRGYSQKSFLILTKLPFLRFFEKLSEFLVFKLFALEQHLLHQELTKIKKQSETWPDPEPLNNYVLPVLDYQIPIEIPNYLYDFNGLSLIKIQKSISSRKEKQTNLQEIVTQQTLLQFGRFQQVKLTEHFQGCYQQLWQIWQCAILNRPMLIMSDSPYRSSQAVLAALSLLNPLEYGGQFYPYVTVYDTHLNDLQQAQNDLIFGATNPLFYKLFAKNNIQVVQLGNPKVPKHLKPLRELFVKSKLQEQKIVNESALRKFFYKLNCGIISIIDEYIDLQTNDLKFLNQKDFLRFVRKREGENILLQVLDGKKYVQLFWESFVKTLNFSLLLRSKNIVRERC